MKYVASILALVSTIAALGAARPAAAQTDFASCPAVLPACSGEELNDCCYRNFDPVSSDRAVIIPLDRCHQSLQGAKNVPPNAGTASPAWCGDPGASADEGIFQAYGLVYRLMQRGMKVYWIINPTKDPPALTLSQNANAQTYIASDIDVWVLGPSASSPPVPGSSLTSCSGTCVDPVKKIDQSTMLGTANSYNYTAFPVRGSAFIIAPSDRARFNDFIRRTGEFASLASDSHYNFAKVDMYEVTTGSMFAYQDFRTSSPYAVFNGGNSAPVALRIDYAPPRLARLAPGGPSAVWLTTAKLDDPATTACKTGAFSPSDAVYCDVSEADIQGGTLVNGRFDWAWIDNWSDNSPCGSAIEITQVDKVREFMTAVPGVRAGGNVMFMDAVIEVFEKCPQKQLAGRVGAATGLASINQTPGEPLILRRPQSLFMQWGDIPTSFASGSTGKWQYFGNGASGYDPAHSAATGSLVRLITEDRAATGNALCTAHKSTAACDVFADNANSDYVDASMYLRFMDNPANGVVFYQGGNNVNGRDSQLRHILNAVIALPAGIVTQETPVREVSRSAPIVASVASGPELHYQGTFELVAGAQVPSYVGSQSNSTFEFPFLRGHLRAINPASLGTSVSDFGDFDAKWDAADAGMIPTAVPGGCSQHFTSGCRTVFTTTAAPDSHGRVSRPDRVYFDTRNLSALKPLLSATLNDADTATLISRVLAGVPDPNHSGSYVSRLGGIDRSTMAIIESSPFASTTTSDEPRPTIVYVGALDGMLHAICAEARGPCAQAGQELWAYIPRSQLGRLSTNTQRIDGTPKVVDVSDDFDGDGDEEWRTILAFQTGSGSVSTANIAPAVIALDVTDPADPQVLWERIRPAHRGPVELGIGLRLAMGQAQVDGTLRNLTLAQTQNGGTGSAGWYLAAIDTATGDIAWEVDHLYPSPRAQSSPPVPATGIPGGVAAIDENGSGLISHIAVSDLYGDLYIHEADGTNPYGTSPVLRFSTDYHPIGAPPSIYTSATSGRDYVLVASGSYVDPIAATWTLTTTTHYAVSVVFDPSAANVPMNEAGNTDSGGERGIVATLGVNARVIGQVVLAGGELLIATDSTDTNLVGYGATSSTGSLRRFSLATGQAKGTAIAIAGGGSTFDVNRATGVVSVGSGGAAQRIAVSSTGGGGAFDSSGEAVETESGEGTTRLLWFSK